MSRALPTLLIALALAACTSPAPSRQLPDPAPDTQPEPAPPALWDSQPTSAEPPANEAAAAHDVRTQMLLVQVDNELKAAKRAYEARDFDRSIGKLEEARQTLERLQTSHHRDESTRLQQVSDLIERVKRDRASSRLNRP